MSEKPPWGVDNKIFIVLYCIALFLDIISSVHWCTIPSTKLIWIKIRDNLRTSIVFSGKQNGNKDSLIAGSLRSRRRKG